MSNTLEQIKALVAKGEVRISEHGYDQLAADGLLARDLVSSVPGAELLEDYPGFPKGPCVLVLQQSEVGTPVHAVWGIPRGQSSSAVLVAAYQPDPELWSADFRRRKT
jgi:hypothetical protein